jgi:hypothetical protein
MLLAAHEHLGFDLCHIVPRLLNDSDKAIGRNSQVLN